MQNNKAKPARRTAASAKYTPVNSATPWSEEVEALELDFTNAEDMDFSSNDRWAKSKRFDREYFSIGMED